MTENKVPSHGLGGWLVVGMSAPFVYLAGRQNWSALLAAGAVCAVVLWVVLRRPVSKLLAHPVLCIIEYGFLAVACGVTANWSCVIWPSGQGFPLVPLTLLALAVASAFWGAGRAAKSIGVLFWLIIILYSIFLGLGIQNIQLQNLAPVWEIPAPVTWFVLLIPCVIQFIPCSQTKKSKKILPLVCIAAAVLGIWTEGNLSADIAKTAQWPFYEAGESIHLRGVANRLESFMSVGATFGFYGLFSLMLSAGGHLAESFRKGWGKWGTALMGVLAGTAVLARLEIPYFVLSVGAFVLWGALPVLASLFPEKKSKKEQNNA